MALQTAVCGCDVEPPGDRGGSSHRPVAVGRGSFLPLFACVVRPSGMASLSHEGLTRGPRMSLAWFLPLGLPVAVCSAGKLLNPLCSVSAPHQPPPLAGPASRSAGSRSHLASCVANLPLHCQSLVLQEDLALIISNTKRRPRMIKEKSPSGYHSG